MGSGYLISFDEFVSLLSESSIVAMLESWFEGRLADSQLAKTSGEIMSLNEVYEAIQANEEQQYKLYQAAMNIWR